ncbi:MAG TPA: acyltransferase [Pseudolabrys sp.]|nr:acyltransferase [Pseudolabrys sp.]
MPKANLALSNLRGVVIVIVVAFHSSLAYLASVPPQPPGFNQPPYTWEAFPVVDAHRFLGLDVFCAWQDISLMSLMFLLAGLLTAPSLRRKGSWTYLLNRLWRIGLPFALAILFLSPLALYPAYATRTLSPSLSGYLEQWLALPFWPNGPEWFLWQLLALSALAAAFYGFAPRYLDRLGVIGSWAGARPLRLFAILIAASMLAYVPLALAFSPTRWSVSGPFALQFSRPGLYFVYFFAGVALGKFVAGGDLFASSGPLARRWVTWAIVAVAAFCGWAGLTSLTLPDWNDAAFVARLGASIAFPVACAAGGLFLIAACARFSRRRYRILDGLSAHAYGIYLVHYVFVVWLQYALLGAALPAPLKAAIVFSGALTASWIVVAVGLRALSGAFAFSSARHPVQPATH